MKELNPIARKLRSIRDAGTSFERICVLADLKYPTFMNIFDREQVSKATRKALLYVNIITKEDEAEYGEWIKGRKVTKSKKSNRGAKAAHSTSNERTERTGKQDGFLRTAGTNKSASSRGDRKNSRSAR